MNHRCSRDGEQCCAPDHLKEHRHCRPPDNLNGCWLLIGQFVASCGNSKFQKHTIDCANNTHAKHDGDCTYDNQKSNTQIDKESVSLLLATPGHLGSSGRALLGIHQVRHWRWNQPWGILESSCARTWIKIDSE